MASSEAGQAGSDGMELEDKLGWEVEEKLQEISRLVSIGELTSGVAHEINNPLSIVAGFAELLMDYSLPQPLDEYVQKIYDESSGSEDCPEPSGAFQKM